MEPTERIDVVAVVERKAPSLPRFAVVPAAAVEPLGLIGTTVMEGDVAGVDLGRRTLKRWDDERWFVELPEGLCRRAGVDTGAEVHLHLRVAPETMPEELSELMKADAEARAAWDRLSSARQRALREEILALKTADSRRRRASRALRRRD